MDPLTHTATGLFLSRAGLNRLTPYATPILILAANAPDIDIVTAAGGSLNYLNLHRHLTHSLVAMPVMALLSVAVVWAAGGRRLRWVGAIAAALVAVISHLLLDLTNVYGVRLLLPFSSRWQRLDLTNVIDFWIWGAFLLCVAAPFLGRLVGSEISSGSGKDRHHGRGWAWFALSFLLLYNCGRAVLHGRAVASLESRVYEESQPVRTAALPDALNPWKWRGLVETREFYAEIEVKLLADFDPSGASIFHKPEPDPALEAAQRTTTFQDFLRFSQFPFWRVTPIPEPAGARRVEAMDLRFGSPASPRFVASAIADANGRVVESSFEFGQVRPR
jgi:inner membrane protein